MSGRIKTPLVEIPEVLTELLAQSILEGPVGILVAQISSILHDNKMPFFPAYTDHGTEHIAAVLSAIAELIPEDVKSSGLLSATDAAVLVSAALLHDVALHITEAGFMRLVHGESEHRPVPWFQSRLGEEPWHEEWKRYLHEAKRYSDADLSKIYGPCSADNSDLWCVRIPPTDSREWNAYDRLLIGEFIRRHHARLAHEIALSGFPGLSDRDNTAFELLEDYRDLVGVVARSHGMPLRTSLDYLRCQYEGNLRPLNSMPVFLMALLRVADYLQIDKPRAPSALLDLRQPQSPISLDEWKKHETVVDISFSHVDPEAIHIQVGNRHSLRTHIQLLELIQGLQRELDLSSAVLSEVYGRLLPTRFNCVKLSKSRVCSNIESSELRDQLDYVPIATKFRVDPNVLVLLVEPLYGDNPTIAIRELLQNALDAVRERVRYCENRGIDVASLNLREQECDVVLSLEESEDGSWHLRCSDSGVGMDLTTVTDYFLRAGASYRDNPDWRAEFIDDEGHSTVTRSGRFGIGVFATFLLGNSFYVETRPITDRTGFGLAFTAHHSQDLIEIRRKELPIGTSVHVKLACRLSDRLLQAVEEETDARHDSGLWRLSYDKDDEDDEDFEDDKAPTRYYSSDTYDRYLDKLYARDMGGSAWDWYTLNNPTVRRLVVYRNGSTVKLEQAVTGPGEFDKIGSANWHRFSTGGMGKVIWTYSDFPALTCNGIVVKEGQLDWSPTSYTTSSLECPRVCAIDPDSSLPLTLDRSKLTRRRAGFEDKLLADVEVDLVAFLLATAPPMPAWYQDSTTLDYKRRYPLMEKALLDSSNLQVLPLSWVSTVAGIFPYTPFFVSSLHPRSIVFYGAPGVVTFKPVIGLKESSLLCPMVVRTSNIGQVLGHIVRFQGCKSFVGLSGFVGLRALVFCSSEKLSRSRNAFGLTKYKGMIHGSHIHEIEIGRCGRQSFDIDLSSVSKSTFSHGLSAIIVEAFGPISRHRNDNDRVTDLWMEAVDGIVMPYGNKNRNKLYDRLRKHTVLCSYLENWLSDMEIL